MFQKLVLVIFVAISIIGIDAQKLKKVKCTPQALKKADRCGEQLFFAGENSRVYPTSEEDAQKYCAESQTLVRCVKSFTDSCALNPISKNLANVMLYTSRNAHKSMCVNRGKRTRLVEVGKCANGIRAQTNKCVSTMLKEFGQSLGLKNPHMRVPYGCCSFHKMRDCIRDVTDVKCDEKSATEFDNFIQTLAGNTLQLMCSEYDEDESGGKCKKVLNLKFDPKLAKTPTSLIRAFGELIEMDDKPSRQ